MKVCFIGLGSIGTRHCGNLAALCQEKSIPLTIHAVRSTKRPLREELRRLNIKLFQSFDEMDHDYDAIFVTNPTSLHYDTLMKVGDRARCFFIEKPVFESPDEDTAALPFHKDAICYVAAPLRYTAVLQAAPSVISTHKVYSVRAISSSYLPDWRPGTDYRKMYSAKKAQGGGVSIDLIHEWDYLTGLFGYPVEVRSLIGRYSHLEIDSDDLAVYIAAYQDKLIEVHLDYFGRETVRKMELLTESGTFTFDIFHATISYPDGSQTVFHETANDKYLAEMRYFLSLVFGKRSTSWNTIEHAATVLRIAQGGVP